MKKDFAAYVTAHLRTPFQWGTHDCVTFAAGWAKIATGRDYICTGRSWSSRAEARAIIAELGGMEYLLDQSLTRIHPNFAQDGDITLLKGTINLFSGATICAPGDNGLVFNPRMEATCAWKL